MSEKKPDVEALPLGTSDVERVEAPVTVKAYLMCAFAAFGGIFFGYDTGKSSNNLHFCYVVGESN